MEVQSAGISKQPAHLPLPHPPTRPVQPPVAAMPTAPLWRPCPRRLLTMARLLQPQPETPGSTLTQLRIKLDNSAWDTDDERPHGTDVSLGLLLASVGALQLGALRSLELKVCAVSATVFVTARLFLHSQAQARSHEGCSCTGTADIHAWDEGVYKQEEELLAPGSGLDPGVTFGTAVALAPAQPAPPLAPNSARPGARPAARRRC